MKGLIAFPAYERELAETLKEELTDRAEMIIVTTAEEAEEKIERSAFAVLVVHEYLPSASTNGAHGAGGLAFLERLRARRINTRTALLFLRTSFTPSEFQQVTELQDITLFPHDEAVIPQLVAYVLSSKTPPSRLDITVDLAHWKYRISGEKYLPLPLEGVLELNAAEVEDLHKLSVELDGDANLWRQNLRRLRDELWHRLVANQKDFGKQLAEAMDKSGAIENTCLRFQTARENYDVAFEAIRHPNAPSDYWMLRAPVYRTLGFGIPAEAPPLFQPDERQELSCLIVLADAPGVVQYGERRKRYKPMTRGRAECEGLCDVLTHAYGTHLKIGKMGFGGGEPVTLESLRERLTPDDSDRNRRWDVVHFVGHTDFVQGLGYFIVSRPGSDASPEAVRAQELAPLLANSRLLYLSSCDSASAAFVFRLAERGVRSLLGFSMRISDSLALEHATEFYRNLFRVRSTEDAFLATRQHFYHANRGSRVWARAMLILPA